MLPQLQHFEITFFNSSLDPESFSGLGVLTELDLSNNLLTNIQTELFRQLHKIQV